jgi:hypothetical protein
MSESKGDETMGVAKPIRPMQIDFESDQDAYEFARWAVSKQKSMTEASKRVRSQFREYRRMKQRRMGK